MLKNKKSLINIKYIKKLFSLLIGFFIIYSTFIIFNNDFLSLTVCGQPVEPTDFIASAVNTSQINLSWTLGFNSDKTYIERNTIPSWNLFEGAELYNDTGISTSDTNLDPHKTYYYQAWSWNETDNMFSSSFVSGNDTTWNTLPSIGTPSPTNGSTDVDLSLNWSLFISDGDGDIFNWSIECSNGQSNNSTDEVDGIKDINISGLDYSTLYTVWVNVTDNYDLVEEWFTFTTVFNNSPVYGSPTTTNGSTGNPVSLTWSIQVNDSEGDSFDWTIQCSNGQSTNENGAFNGTKSLSLSGLTYLTTYDVWVNATDPGGSGLYTREWYHFITIANQSPFFGTPNPTNGSTNQPTSFTWSIPINDSEGDFFSWTIHCSNGQTNNATGEINGTKSLLLSGLSYVTVYTIWVNATDSYDTTSAWFTFYTRSYSGGDGSQQPGTPTDNPPSISGISRTPANVNSENNVTISATVTDDNSLYSVYLYWNDGSQHSKEMTFDSNNKYSTEIGPFAESITIIYWINATDNALQSTESISYSFTVADISGPTITDIKPTPGAIVYDTTPTIKVSFNDPSNIDIKSVILTIDDINLTPQNITSSSVSYTPISNMTYTTHTVKINVSDLIGNSQIKEWSFTIKESEFITEDDIGNLSIGEEKEILLESSDETGIDSINLNVSINLTNVKITIAKLKDKPEIVSDLPTTTTLYCYLQIEITANYTDIDYESIYSLKLKFKIKNDWLTNQNIDKNNIDLIKYKNGIWVIQDTNYLTEDSIYTYYEASMPEFSTVAIVGTIITTGEITTVSEFNYFFIVIAVILIIISIVIILFKTGILYIEEENTEEKENR